MKNLTRLLILSPLALLIAGCEKNDDGGMYAGEYGPGYAPYGERYEDYGENPFVSVSEKPTSTFAVDCDGASYSNMRRYLNLGQRPPKASVRLEEYINYFTFDYPSPGADHNVSIDTEMSTCPWNAEHMLLRVGLKGRSIPQAELPATNYVLLIDVSGSMASPDKLGILKTGFSTLIDQLRECDRVAIVTYAGYAQVALPSTSCENKQAIKNAINKLGAGGSTAGAQGLMTAYEIAVANYIPGGNNRIIIGSDGDFNVGPSSDEELVELIEAKRDLGIYLTVLGVGGGNLNDSMMEKIANKGNGTYEYIDNAAQLEKVFIHEKERFHIVAGDCKVQVTFNPVVVDQYRLLGYENRVLEDKDFEDDAKDAGDIGSGQTVTALYEIISGAHPALGDASYLASVDIRYKKPGSDASVLLSAEASGAPAAIASASENMRFAAGVAAWGLMMKESAYAGSVSKDMVVGLADNARSFDPNGYRNQFVELVKKAK